MAKNRPPSISANKLGEYIISKGARQRSILRDQKYRSIAGMYYSEATKAISLCLASNLEDVSGIERAIRVLEQKHPDTAGAMRRIHGNIDALESFESMLDDIDLQGTFIELGEHRPDKLVIQGVHISVRPGVILRGSGKSKKKLIGGVKLHFSRTFPHSDVSAGYVSAVLQRYSEDKLASVDEVASPSYCFVIDVGSRTIFPPVKSKTQRLKDIESDCRNIAAIWPTITK